MPLVTETEFTDTSGLSWVDFNSSPIDDTLNQDEFNYMRLELDSTVIAFMHTESDNIYSGISNTGDSDTFSFSATKGSSYGVTIRHLDYFSDGYVEKFVEIQIFDKNGDSFGGFFSSGFGFIEGERTWTVNDFPFTGDAYLILTLRRADDFISMEDIAYAYSFEIEVLNNGPTGLPSISGIPGQGYELFADTSNIADLDGLGDFYFRWMRDGNQISGANESQFTLGEADVGREISVKVSYTDLGGAYEEITSDRISIPASTSNVSLTNSDDAYTGTNQPEFIVAKGGDDTIIASKGDDQIDGGTGIDLVSYDGDQDAYTVTLGPSGVQVRDRRPDGNGTDTLTNIEFLDFDTGDFANFNLDQFGGATALNEADFKGFIELYIAYFNRAPDAVGLNFWGTAYANGTTMEQMAKLFAPQPETLNTYPEGTSNTEFATAVYNNVLGRTPDQAGFDFWVRVLDGEWVTRDQFILEVLRGVQDGSPDRSYLDNKVDVGAYFAVHKGMSDTGNAAAAMQLYNGTDASIQTVKQAIDAYHLEALDPISGEFLLPLVGVLDDPFV